MQTTKALLLSSTLALALLALGAEAQSQPIDTPAPLPAPAANISSMLSRLDQIAQSMQINLAKLRVDRWKADSSTKAQAEGDVTSLQRNLSSALPNVVGAVRNDPASLPNGLKLYRNVNALYEVLSTVTEYAGAFGSKEEYRSLGSDTANLDDARRLLVDQLEGLASVKESQIVELRNQVQTARATAAPPEAPKKIVVDDNAPAKKAPKKKKPAATATGAPTPGSSSPQ